MVARGTLLNTATVAVGGAIGWLAGAAVPEAYSLAVFGGLGIVVIGLGMKMMLDAKNLIVVAGAIALGGIVGTALGIQPGLDGLAETVKRTIGAEGDRGFVETLVGASILYCVGPMTLLGCIQDRLEGKIDLLAVKSTMDGFVAVFFGAISGPAILATAAVVLVFQGALTLLAGSLKPIADDEEMLSDLSGTGGVMLVAIGIGLIATGRGEALQGLKLPVAAYLPALVFAPLLVLLGAKLRRRPA